MNPSRRKELSRALALNGLTIEIVSDVAERERETRARVPDELADTDRATAMDRAITAMEAANASLTEAAEHITEAAES